MIGTRTVRFGLAALLAAGTLALVGAPASAQGFGGGGGMPPAIAAKIKAWQKWGDQHKKLTGLGDLIQQVGIMDKDPTTALDKKQAGQILKIVTTWKPKTSLSEDEAQTITKQMTSVLSLKQIKKIATIEPPSVAMRRRGFGGGGGGGARPGGGGARPAGNFTFPDPPAKGWNPLNPDSLPFPQGRPMAKARMAEFTNDLQSRK